MTPDAATCPSCRHEVFSPKERRFRYPHLLNPCECGTFLPVDVEPGPLLSSAMGLLSDLNRLKAYAADMPPNFSHLIDAMMEMAERSLATNTALEVR